MLLVNWQFNVTAVATKLASHTDIKFCLAVGGLSLKVQERNYDFVPINHSTPGRLLIICAIRASFTVDTLEILVLNEADRILKLGLRMS